MRPHHPFASLLALVLLACGAPPAEQEPSTASSHLAARGGVLRIVTWNVHDLFDEEDRTEAPGDEDLVLPHAAVEAKLDAIARVLRRIDADVAVLQEVENEALLRRLAERRMAGGGYATFLREGFDPRGIDVGVLSRVPFAPGPSRLEDRGPDGRRLWSRDPVEVTLSGELFPVVVIGAHLVSRLDPAEDDRRRAQAARLRAIADDLRRASPRPCVIVVGDLNDLPDAPALGPLLADGNWVDLGRALPSAAAWTWGRTGLRERMDYALIARDDASRVTRVVVEDGADVAAASDHRPLVVDVWAGLAAQ